MTVVFDSRDVMVRPPNTGEPLFFRSACSNDVLARWVDDLASAWSAGPVRSEIISFVVEARTQRVPLVPTAAQSEAIVATARDAIDRSEWLSDQTNGRIMPTVCADLWNGQIHGATWATRSNTVAQTHVAYLEPLLKGLLAGFATHAPQRPFSARMWIEPLPSTAHGRMALRHRVATDARGSIGQAGERIG